MPKPSHREKILAEGLRVVHERGFSGTSVRDIAGAAEVPLGSFTNHFGSKEAFGLEILEIYLLRNRETRLRTLGDESLPPLVRIRAWVDAITDPHLEKAIWNGCLLGNFGVEAGDGTESIRHRLGEIFGEIRTSVAGCLVLAVERGELDPATEIEDLADFIVSSLQGALLRSRAERSPAPIERFRRILFSTLLR